MLFPEALVQMHLFSVLSTALYSTPPHCIALPPYLYMIYSQQVPSLPQNPPMPIFQYFCERPTSVLGKDWHTRNLKSEENFLISLSFILRLQNSPVLMFPSILLLKGSENVFMLASEFSFLSQHK